MIMAKRPVFFPISRAPYVDVYQPEFSWSGGFAASQKQKNIDALHEAFLARFPGRNPLEISSKSRSPLGVSLSAFNLKKTVPSLGISVPVECVFQGGKVFSGGGPFTDLYAVSPREAKRDPRLKERGMLKSFYYEGETYPTVPGTAFYDWLYIRALLENPELSRQLTEFDAFTDIEFNPDRSINCQARAAALFVALSRQGLLEQCWDFTSFAALLR